MARDVIERELTAVKTGRVNFGVASEGDDADIRRLLRENPMPGKISLLLEREPDFFADANLPGETKQTIIARDDNRVVCVGSCTVRKRFINGEPRSVGYLGGLRLDASQAGRFNILRRGYEFFRELQAAAPADFYFTSIAADNDRARMLLERGLPGMPRYEFIGEFVTILVPTGHWNSDRNDVADTTPPAEQLIPLLNRHNSRHQFAPFWSAVELAALQPLGLQPENFRFIREGKQVVAGAALWDQRAFRQTVIGGYTASVAMVRPVLNLVTSIAGGMRLPAIGETLGNAFVSQLAVELNEPEFLIRLLAELRGMASRSGIEFLTLGFAANDPRLAVLRKNIRGREYHSRLYVVRWPEFGGAAQELDGRILAPEVAWL